MEASTRPLPEKLLGSLWFEGELCFLFGNTGVGKSILAVQAADAIVRGLSCGKLLNTAGPKRVLYADFELSDMQFLSRYQAEDGRIHIFPEQLHRTELEPAEQPDGVTFEEALIFSLELSIVENGYQVVIIDNYTYFSNELDKGSHALGLMKKLKELKKKYPVSILILGHTPKRSSGEPLTRDDLAGSKMLINFCDSAFAIGESKRVNGWRYLKQIKCRQAAFEYDEENVMLFRIEKPDTFTEFRFMGFGEEAEHLTARTKAEDDELVANILVLHREGSSQRDIADQLGISRHKVRKALGGDKSTQ